MSNSHPDERRFRNLNPRENLTMYVATLKTIIPSKPAKYTPPAHVHQFTPDYSMLSLSKPKRKRKKQDDLTVSFGGVGSTISRKRPRRKKRKKQVCLQQFSYLFSVFHLVLEIGKFSCYSIRFDH